jgi:hypothetical protein
MQNPNDHIVLKLYPIIKDQTEGTPDNAYWQYIAATATSGTGVDTREVSNRIIQSFPWPIGVEIRRLFSGDRRERNKERLEQALKVAEKATQFLALILLAQLWEEGKAKKINITADFHRQFTGIDKPSFGIWAGIVRSIYLIFESENIPPFANPFTKNYSAKSFIKQVERLVEIRNSEAHFYKQSDADELEEVLTDFLCNISFLVRYKLIAVSEIEVLKTRLSKVSFKHSLRILNSPHEDFSSEDKSYESFFESHAILLFRDFQSAKEHLNLSPFIIDTSVYLRNERVEGIKPGIYVYNGMRNGNFLYYFTSGYEYAALNTLPLFSELEKEFTDLKIALQYEKPL